MHRILSRWQGRGIAAGLALVACLLAAPRHAWAQG